jgi:hypothetical protein
MSTFFHRLPSLDAVLKAQRHPLALFLTLGTMATLAVSPVGTQACYKAEQRLLQHQFWSRWQSRFDQTRHDLVQQYPDQHQQIEMELQKIHREALQEWEEWMQSRQLMLTAPVQIVPSVTLPETKVTQHAFPRISPADWKLDPEKVMMSW